MAPTLQLARTALVDVTTVLLAIGGTIALIRFKLNTTWPVVGSAAVGAIVKAAQ
jgi:hypothetical protein